jgi:hypothetical protein
MTWLTWRQFRIPALSVFAGLAVIVVTLVITGSDMGGRTNYSDEDTLYAGTLLAMFLLPAVIGVFWGVPIVTREVETGTHSLVWNQTVTRKRWLTTKMGIGVLAATVAAGLLSLAVTWWASPIDALAAQETNNGMLNRLMPPVFAARGIVPIGYAAFAFILGVAVGMVLRRTVAAMAVTLVVFAAVMIAVPFLVRPYLLPPLQETVTLSEENIRQITGSDEGIESIETTRPPGAWVLTNETIDPAGNVVYPLPAFVSDCLPRPPKNGEAPAPPPVGNIRACVAQLADKGYHQQLSYQPGYRFWALQWLELAFFLALSALLAWFCFRRLRHLS